MDFRSVMHPCENCNTEISGKGMSKHRKRCAGIIERETKKVLEAMIKDVEAEMRPDKRTLEYQEKQHLESAKVPPCQTLGTYTPLGVSGPGHSCIFLTHCCVCLTVPQKVKWETPSVLSSDTPQAAAAPVSTPPTALEPPLPPSSPLLPVMLAYQVCLIHVLP
jgi:hypothetical protein